MKQHEVNSDMHIVRMANKMLVKGKKKFTNAIMGPCPFKLRSMLCMSVVSIADAG